MAQFLRYGDATSLLNKIDSRLGSRKVHRLRLTQRTVRMDASLYHDAPFEKDTIMLYQTTNGVIYSYDDFWRQCDRHDIAVLFCLARDETTKEFHSRLEESQKIMAEAKSSKGTSKQVIITRPYPLYSVNESMHFNTVSDLLKKDQKQIDLYRVDTTGYLSPKHITDIVISFLIRRSESKDCFSCDKQIESPSTLFRSPKQYFCNQFINDLLKRYHLLDNSHQTIDDFQTLSGMRMTEVKKSLQLAFQAQQIRQSSESFMSRLTRSYFGRKDMPQFLRYGDARALLKEIKEKFGSRKHNDIKFELKSVDVPI